MRAPYRGRFDPEREFVARRAFGSGVATVRGGETIDKTRYSLRRLRQMFDARMIQYPGETPGGIIRPEPPAPPSDPMPERTAVEIDDDWEGLSWQKQLSIASKLEPGVQHNRAQSIELIKAEIARRAFLP